MKRTAFAIALLFSGAALADPTTDAALYPDASTTVQTEPMPVNPVVETYVDGQMPVTTDPSLTTSTRIDTTTPTTLASMTPASGIVQPSNANPERDARGIAVISDAATVPAGWNGTPATATGMGGPLVDPATGATLDTADTADTYPACSASVTDNCLQTYERGRSS